MEVNKKSLSNGTYFNGTDQSSFSDWCSSLTTEYANILVRVSMLLTPAAASICFYSMLVLIAFGCLGNLLAFIIMFPSIKKKNTTSFYLCSLAVFDTCCLIFSGSSYLIGMIWPSFAYHNGLSSLWIYKYLGWPIMCRLRLYLSFVSRTCCIWTIVIFSIERMFVVRSPLRGAIICTLKRAKMAICALFILSFPLNSFALFSFQPRWNKKYNLTMCSVNEHFIKINFLDTTLLCVVPGTIILICNIIIIYTVRSKKRDRAILCPSGREKEHKERDITRRLLIISTVFLICTSPLNIFSVFRNILFLKCQTLARVPPLSDLLLYFLFLFHVNSGINFFLYTFTSHNFRHALLGILRCSKREFLLAQSKDCSKSEGGHKKNRKPSQDVVTQYSVVPKKMPLRVKPVVKSEMVDQPIRCGDELARKGFEHGYEPIIHADQPSPHNLTDPRRFDSAESIGLLHDPKEMDCDNCGLGDMIVNDNNVNSTFESKINVFNMEEE